MKANKSGAWSRPSIPAGPLRARAHWVPLVGLLVTTLFVSWPRVGIPESDRWYYVVAFPIGLAIGAAWQLLGRRDLADRLLYPVSASVLGIPAFMLLPRDSLTLSPSTGEVLLGILVGLVLAEHWLRYRDRRTARTPIAAAPVAEPEP